VISYQSYNRYPYYYRRKYYNNNVNINDNDNKVNKLFEGDIVEFIKGDSRELGAITKVKTNGNLITVHPLCLRPSDSIDDINTNNNDDYIIIPSTLDYNKDLELYYDDSADSISIEVNNINVIRDGVILTQRVIEDRISNPHSEHAEDCWIINLKAADFSNNDTYKLKLNIRIPEH
jgi:hypothetical protein